MRTIWKRLISLNLALLMCLTLIVPAWADNDDGSSACGTIQSLYWAAGDSGHAVASVAFEDNLTEEVTLSKITCVIDDAEVTGVPMCVEAGEDVMQFVNGSFGVSADADANANADTNNILKARRFSFTKAQDGTYEAAESPEETPSANAVTRGEPSASSYWVSVGGKKHTFEGNKPADPIYGEGFSVYFNCFGTITNIPQIYLNSSYSGYPISAGCDLNLYLNSGVSITGASNFNGGDAIRVSGDLALGGGPATITGTGNGVGVRCKGCVLEVSTLEIRGGADAWAIEDDWSCDRGVTVVASDGLVTTRPWKSTLTLDGGGGFTDKEESSYSKTFEYRASATDLRTYADSFHKPDSVQVGWTIDGKEEQPVNGYLFPDTLFPNGDGSAVTATAKWEPVSDNEVVLYTGFGSTKFSYQKYSGSVTLPETAVDYDDSGNQQSVAYWCDSVSESSDWNGVVSGAAWLAGEALNAGSVASRLLLPRPILNSTLVAYHPNGGAVKTGGSVAMQQGWSGTSTMVAIDGSYFDAPAGKTLAGWSETENGAVKYAPGQHVSCRQGAVTHLYAVWGGSADSITLYAPSGYTFTNGGVAYQSISASEALPTQIYNTTNGTYTAVVAWGENAKIRYGNNNVTTGPWYAAGSKYSGSTSQGAALYALITPPAAEQDEDKGGYVVYKANSGAAADGGSAVVQWGWSNYRTYLIDSSYFVAPAGKTLIGWSETPDGAAKYLPGYRYPSLVAAGSVKTLYAVWDSVTAGTILLHAPYGYAFGSGSGAVYQKYNTASVALPSVLYNTSTGATVSVAAWSENERINYRSYAVAEGAWYGAGTTISSDATRAIQLYPAILYDTNHSFIVYRNVTPAAGGNVVLQYGMRDENNRVFAPVVPDEYFTIPNGQYLTGWATSVNGNVAYQPTRDINSWASRVGLTGGTILQLYPKYAADNRTQLGKPTDLYWGKFYQEGGYWDDEQKKWVGDGNWRLFDAPDAYMTSWDSGTLTQNRVRFAFYYRAAEDAQPKMVWNTILVTESTQERRYFNAGVFLNIENTEFGLRDGWYSFTVQNVGDGNQYKDSEVAESPLYHYVAPAARLATPSDLTWDGNIARWSGPVPGNYEVRFGIRDERYVGGYQIVRGGFANGSTSLSVPEVLNSSGKTEKLYFSVRAMSSDLTVTRSSEWSDWSAPLLIANEASAVSAIVNQRLANVSAENVKYASKDEKEEVQKQVETAVESIKEINVETLAETLRVEAASSQSTQTTDSATAQLEKLEDLIEATTGKKTEKKVESNTFEATNNDSEAVQATKSEMKTLFTETNISVVGATLNAKENQTATLKIGAAESGDVIDTQLHNAVAFSMDLVDKESGESLAKDDGGGNKKLEIPVKITLPVPSTINAAFLVILHKHANGTVEQVSPTITREGSQNYATFVVTSFSDFAFAEVEIKAESGKLVVSVPAAVAPVESIFCAAYDADGKMLGVASAEVSADKPTSTEIACNTLLARTVKIIALDANNKPTDAAKVYQKSGDNWVLQNP